MKKILIIGSQHGNELLGEALYKYIQSYRRNLLPNVTYKVGNPRAKKANVRYIESDLNRSYTTSRTTYEERRADRIQAYIKKHNFDLVIDAHTTTCDQPPCFIVKSLHSDYLGACFIEKVVIMHPDIVKPSLIGVCHQAVSIEVNKNAVTDQLLDALCDSLDAYCNGKTPYRNKTVYEIDDYITKSEISEKVAAKLTNFHKTTYGYYPVLVGENSYKKQTNYLGFKAYKVYKTKV